MDTTTETEDERLLAACRKFSTAVTVTNPKLSAMLSSMKTVRGRCADVFVEALVAEGIEYVYGIPGEENLDFLDAIRLEPRLKLVLTRHEQGAGFMAAITGRLTGRPGVCLATLGPGATNFSTSTSYAYLGGFPAFVITGQKPIRHSKQGRFQILDVVESFKPITKFTHQVTDPSTVPHLVRDCMRISMEEKPGPVHLELPEDIAHMAVNPTSTYLFPAHTARRPIAEDKAISKAVDLLKAARKPLICVAAGSNRKMVTKMVTQFSDKYGLHVVATQMGKGVLNERHPRFLGCAALSQNDIMHVAVENADCILMIGHDIVEKPPFFMVPNKTPVVIHVNFQSAQVDPVYFPQLDVVGDVANALWQMMEVLGDPGPEGPEHTFDWDFSFFEHCAKFFKEKTQTKSEHYNSDNFPMNIQRVVKDLRSALQPSAILSLDNGMYKIHVARLYDALEPNTVLLDNALATMGAGLPAAIGAKIVCPHREVVALSGDGGFMMNSQELETAVRLGIHIIQVIVMDGGFGMIKWKQGTGGFPNFGLDYANPDFIRYAESYGAKGHMVKSADDFTTILRSCLAEKAVHVIAVPIDYKSSDDELNTELEPLVDELRTTAAAWSGRRGHVVSPAAREAPVIAVGAPSFEGPDVGPLATDDIVKPPTDLWEQTVSDWPIHVAGNTELRDAKLDVTDKYTNAVFARVSLGSADDVDRAITAAESALKPMQLMPAYKRKAILHQCVNEFRTRYEEFAYALAREAGKPIHDARGEVTRLIDTFEIAAEESVRMYGEYAPLDISERNVGVQSIVRRFPIGVVSMVSPFNFPLNLAAHKIAPALASGCPFILKPASRTPLGALMIAECLKKTDLPKGAFSVIACDRTVGDLFVTDPRPKLLTFTGSPGVGWGMKERCGKKKLVLELGGNAACILDSWDEDHMTLDAILDRITFGAFYQSGQSCIHLQRLFVHEDHYATVIPKLVEKTKALKKGNPLQPDCFVGPLITTNDAKRIEKWVNDAVRDGASVLAGGNRYDQVYDATIVENCRRDLDLYVEEAFAPVVTVEPYRDFKTVIDVVNKSKFGIHMGLFTTDLNKTYYAWENTDVGGVVVGDVPSYRCDAQPYGGVKDSGIGREGVRYAMEDMTEVRVLLLKNAGKI